MSPAELLSVSANQPIDELELRAPSCNHRSPLEKRRLTVHLCFCIRHLSLRSACPSPFLRHAISMSRLKISAQHTVIHCIFWEMWLEVVMQNNHETIASPRVSAAPSFRLPPCHQTHDRSGHDTRKTISSLF